MARNKYPEVTVEKILDVSKWMFLQKGYENTTIQDIVNELGGLTKGAIYHHFKSKEDIMNALGDKLIEESNFMEQVKDRSDLNGLQKIQEVIRLNQTDVELAELSRQSVPLLKNPRILVEMLESNLRVIVPMLQMLIEEGIQDGSIHTKYPKELAEVFQLLTQLWVLPTVFPCTWEETKHKLQFLKEMLECMGLPLLDDTMVDMVEATYWGVHHQQQAHKQNKCGKTNM